MMVSAMCIQSVNTSLCRPPEVIAARSWDRQTPADTTQNLERIQKNLWPMVLSKILEMATHHVLQRG
jgi:hypothetical protein